MCVEEGRVRVDVIQSARSIANQNKTLWHLLLSFRITKGFCVLLDNS